MDSSHASKRLSLSADSLPTDESVSLAAMRKYHHPYMPYKIQVDLMDAIYDTIDNNYKVGMFESPTGTGKTLSIICSTMTWLRNYKKNTVFTNVAEVAKDSDSSWSDDSDEEWVKNDYQHNVLSGTKSKLKNYEDYLTKIRQDYENSVQEVSQLDARKRIKRAKPSKNSELKETDYLPRDYTSDNEFLDTNLKLKNEIDTLLKKVDGSQVEVEMANECPVKIYFSSRTHSQLNQFGNQLNLCSFESSFNGISERTKYLPFASRKQLCINDEVRNVSKSDSNINDACLDLQNKKSDSCCKFLPQNSTLPKKFADLSLSRINDIEDLTDLGTNLKVCPYYSIRSGVEQTEIISLPYQMLLQQSTRRILDLDIKDSIIVIDEAHNLLDTITSLNSVSVSMAELQNIMKSLKFYLSRFLRKLNSGNRINLMKLIKLCQILISFIETNEKANKIKVGNEMHINELLNGSNGDLFNIHKLEAFLNSTKIAYKIESYIEKMKNEEADAEDSRKSSTPLLFKIIKFLKSLNNPSREGKFFWNKSDRNEVCIDYMLLDPSAIFNNIISEARCVLLLGGTMEPISDFTNYLFPLIPPEKIKFFGCGHIIPEENLKVFTISKYRDNHQFDFSFKERNEARLILNLGELVIDISRKVPSGVVIFFPSYSYLNSVMSAWKLSDIYNRIESIKTIFQEPSDSTKVETLLVDYTHKIKSEKKGAVLFSVVGGKMSEGINFSDELARAVVMVGLPFPNAFSGELIAKRKFIEDKTLERGGTREEGIANSRSYYENICMKSVNQSIGRSIRHSSDYSTIFLVDYRYESTRIQNKLSGWVRERVQHGSMSLGEILEETDEFFISKCISKAY